MSDAKLHHLVPKFYLRRFANGDLIELLDRNDLNRVIPISVERALAETYFYSIDTKDGRDPAVETMFADHIETPAARAIRRVVEDKMPFWLNGLRSPISAFVAFQYVRGPGVRHAHVEFVKAIAQKVVSVSTPEMIQSTLRRKGQDITDEEALDLVAFAKGGDYTIDVRHKANLHLGSALKTAVEMGPQLAARTWNLLEFEDPVLVTSDEPVVLIDDPLLPGEALGTKEAKEIVLPLDPRHALVMTIESQPSRSEKTLPGTKAMADIINRHVAFKAHRFVVRHPGTDPLKGLVIPLKAPPVETFGDLVMIQPSVSVEGRKRWRARRRKPGGR